MPPTPDDSLREEEKDTLSQESCLMIVSIAVLNTFSNRYMNPLLNIEEYYFRHRL